MPRSASRDRSDSFNGRRTYFRRATWLSVGKRLFSLIAFSSAVIWVVFDSFACDRGHSAHTHGPLAGPHAAWENDCAACHIGSSAAAFTGDPTSIWKTHERWNNFTCEKCHAGPRHQPNVNQAGEDWHNQCNNCHRDHNGRMNSLTRLADSDCVRCHSELKKHSKKEPAVASRITNFSKDHPDFQSLAGFNGKDRKLKFSHSLHMTPGIVYDSKSKFKTTINQIPDVYKGHYKQFASGENQLISLKCEACHSLDSEIPSTRLNSERYDSMLTTLAEAGPPAAALLPPRAKGAYFQPVNFEMNCRACHPNVATAVVSNNKVTSDIQVPHRLSKEKTIEELKRMFSREIARLDNSAYPPEILPGGRTDPPPKPPFDPKRYQDEVNRHAEKAERQFFPERSIMGDCGPVGGCMKCHVYGDAESKAIAHLPNKTIWMSKAKFDHTAHRSATCVSCHPGTQSNVQNGKTDSRDFEPVQILGLENCRSCHAPGAVRSNCTDCHSYHNGEHPLQGRGAKERAPAEPKNLADFFKSK